MTLDNSGNLLLGATSQSVLGEKLLVNGAGIVVQSSPATNRALIGNFGGSNFVVGSYDSIPMVFRTGNSEAARIDTSGNLLVGTTSGSSKLVVTTSSGTGAYLTFDGSVGNGINLKTTYSSTGSLYINFINSAGSSAGSITQSGTTAVLYNVTSDQRIKTDLGQVTSTNVIDKTIIHDFVWKTDGTQSRGVFAQEAYKVIPQAVKVGDDGEEVEDVWAVDYSKYVPDLIVYCQQLKLEIQSLKAEVATLKGA